MAEKIQGYRHLEDIEIDGVSLTAIYVKATYYFRTSGTNYEFAFHCDLEDEDKLYDVCKKAFEVGKNHVKYDGSIATYAQDHDFVTKIIKDQELLEAGCNWYYIVHEGNDD